MNLFLTCGKSSFKEAVPKGVCPSSCRKREKQVKMAMKSSQQVKFPDFGHEHVRNIQLLNLSKNLNSWRRGSQDRKSDVPGNLDLEGKWSRSERPQVERWPQSLAGMCRLLVWVNLKVDFVEAQICVNDLRQVHLLPSRSRSWEMPHYSHNN